VIEPRLLYFSKEIGNNQVRRRDIAEPQITILIGDADLGAMSPINTITGDTG
jgi:hypothetical protein